MFCPTLLTDLFLFKSIFLIILNYMCFWALECQDLVGLKLQIPMELELLQAFVSHLGVGSGTVSVSQRAVCSLKKEQSLQALQSYFALH